MPLKRGDVLGDWTLERVLGEGGNAIVWLGRSRDGTTVALKVLSKISAKSVARFRSEIAAHVLLDDIPGVLRLVGEAHVPDAPSDQDPAWFAMPEASTIRDALGSRPPLESVLQRAAELAETLSSFASRAAGHRDIKPANLFIYQDRAAVGDLGLATYDGKPELTDNNEHIGPRGYIAPEMLSGKQVDALPADVYTLAKTVWVLATDQKWPPQGQIRVDVSGHRTADFISGPLVAKLDLLLERATADDPQKRPTMVEFGRELRALLSPVAQRTGTPDFSEIRTRIRALEEPAIRLGKKRTETIRQFNEASSRFQSEFEQATAGVREAIGEMAGSDGREYLPLDTMRPDNPVLCSASHGYARSGDSRVLLFIGARLTVYNEDTLVACSGARVFQLLANGSRKVILDTVRERTALVGSAAADHLLSECINDVAAGATAYLNLYLKILESS